MELVQSRLVSDDVESIASFYASLLEVHVTLNGFYVEVPTGAMSVGFSRARYTEECARASCTSSLGARPGEVILDFSSPDVDAECSRIDTLGVHWVMKPMDQPWGSRSMLFRDPEGHLVNVFTRKEGAQ